MSSESIRIKRWIYETLRTDAATSSLIAGRVYNRVPVNATFPLVEFGIQSGRDIKGNGGVRLMSSPLYRIKAIARGGLSASVVQLVDRLDEIFQNKRSETFEGFVFSSTRNGEFDFITPGGDGGGDTFYTHHGAFYRIECSTA